MSTQTEIEALYASALAHHAGRQPDAVLAGCEAVLALDPAHAGALHLRGVALLELRRTDAALASYAAALAVKPDYAEAHYNRGVALVGLGQPEAALQSFAAALNLAPDVADIHVGRGSALEKLGRYEEALAAYDQGLALNPAFDYLRGTRLFAKMRLGAWDGFEADVADITARVARGEKVAPSLAMCVFTDSARVQCAAASIWTRHEHPANPVLGPFSPRPANSRARIGYFSMDFRDHPAALGAAVVLEGHDRSRFETYAFSYGPNSGDAMRARIAKAADHFIDVRDKSDVDAARLARSLGIDVAVDLAGHTTDSRPGIFAARAAPLQVTYLSLPMLADYMDYVITDAHLIPEDDWHFYTEKMAVVPCIIATDRSRVIGSVPSRTSLGLPAQGFVFCAFNGLYKITPGTFSTWMRIVQRVPGSVLWLAGGHARAKANLRGAAARHGVSPARLIFSEHVPAPAYLARLTVADLFLDTPTFTAHSTALDALWAGLPMLTLEGRSPTGRGSASILTAAGMPDLITRSQGDYEEQAVFFAHNPQHLARLRAHLHAQRANGKLFDRDFYIKPLEAVLDAMIARHRAGLAPDTIRMPAP